MTLFHVIGYIRSFLNGIRGHMGFFLHNFLSHRRFRVRVGSHLSSAFLSAPLFRSHLGIRLYGQSLPTQPVARFLGVFFDRRLTYQEHLKVLRERCFKSLNVLKCGSRTSYGVDRITLLLLYRSIIRSKLDYASFVHDGATQSRKRTLDTIHHSSLRVVTGAFRTSPSTSLLAETHEPPLSLRRQMLGMRYALKIRQFPMHPTYPYVFSPGIVSLFEGLSQRSAPFCSRMQDLFANSDVSLHGVMRVDTMSSPPWKAACPQIDISLTDVRKGELLPIELRSRALEYMSKYEGFTLTYTDGSKTLEGVGCAFVSGTNTRSFSLPKQCSVFSSELVAISKALSFIEVCHKADHLVLSDSLSSLLAIRCFCPSSPLVQDILARFTSLEQTGKYVKFCGIPSHVGITGNELADVDARRTASVLCTRRLPLPARYFYPAIGNFVQSQWQHQWDAQIGN